MKNTDRIYRILCASAYIMSKKFWSALVAFGVGSFLSSCNFASPETYFDEAVLNVNLITPFGGQAALNSLAQPSVKLVPGTKDQAAAKHNIKVDWQTRLF